MQTNLGIYEQVHARFPSQVTSTNDHVCFNETSGLQYDNFYRRPVNAAGPAYEANVDLVQAL